MLLQAARESDAAKIASIEAKRNFWLAATNLSAAVLGGGNLNSLDGTNVVANTASE
jgi:outer membrane protein TolC